MKTITHLTALAAAILAPCACRGADAVFDILGGECAVSDPQRHEFATGVVSSVVLDDTDYRMNWFTLRTTSDDVCVGAPTSMHPLDKLLALTDAEVEVRGVAKRLSRWKRFSGRFLMLTDENGIKTAKPAPAIAPEFTGDPFDIKEFARRESQGEFAHRVRLQGLLVTDCSRFLFLEASNGKIVKLIMQTGAKRMKPGTMVSATGFASYDYGGLMMHDVVLAPAPDAPRPPPQKIQETTLNKAHHLARYTNGPSRRIVSFTGEVTAAKEILHRGSLLWLKSENNYAVVDVSSYYDGVQEERDGTIIRVTGVCDPAFVTDPTETAFPRFTGITIIPLPEDGVVVLNPSMWTVKVLKFISVNLLIIIVLVSVALVVQRILYNRRGRQLYEERVAHVRTETKVEERTRLAVELHDAVSQTLTGVALQVDAATRANGDGNPRVGAFLTTVRQMLASCRRELQDCLWDLRTRTFDEKDMTEAISKTIGPHVEGIDIAVRFNVPRERLSESTTHSILSIVRELAINAIKHGKATRIRVAGEYHDGTVTFSVRDNGCGFDPASAPGPREGHFGMRGIRERIHAHKGTMEVSSAPGKGTKITVSMRE